MESTNSFTDIAQSIDHTLLRPDASISQIQQLCQEAIDHNFFSVCINPCYVATCSEILSDTDVKICTVVGFPLGANTIGIKAQETHRALTDGAHEIDMVINIGALKSQKYLLVEEDIRYVVEAAESRVVKVIIETSLLTREEKIKICEIAANAGAHYVKTSTGFSGGGATIDDVILMKNSIPLHMKIKASGGIKNYEQARAFLEAGASRLGTSSGVSIVAGLTSSEFY